MDRTSKILSTLSIVTALSLTSTNTFADGLEQLNPYVGADTSWQRTDAQNDWGSLLPKKYGSGTFFLGNRFCDNFGLELGYSQSVKKTKIHAFSDDQDFFGNGDTGGAIIRTSNRFNGWHVDFNGYCPINTCLDFIGSLDLIGSIGCGWIKPKMQVEVPAVAANGVNPSLLTTPGFFPGDATALSTIQGKEQGVFRVGAGAQVMVCDSVGIRGLLRYESTNNLKVNGNFDIRDPHSTINFQDARKPFKGSYSIALGVFWNFCY